MESVIGLFLLSFILRLLQIPIVLPADSSALVDHYTQELDHYAGLMLLSSELTLIHTFTLSNGRFSTHFIPTEPPLIAR